MSDGFETGPFDAPGDTATRWRHAARLSLLVLLASCSRQGSDGSSPPDGGVPTRQPDDADAPSGGADESRTEADDPSKPSTTSAIDDADRVRLAWCRAGGDGFEPPDPETRPTVESWQYGEALPSCDLIEQTELGSWTAKGSTAVLTRLEVVIENEAGEGFGGVEWKEVLSIRSPSGVADFEIAEQVYDTSGEITDPSIELDLETVEFRDVVGDARPDFIARQDISTYGNFEADRCINTETDDSMLLLCEGGKTGPDAECVSILIASSENNALWSDQSECEELGEPPSPADLEDSSFELTYEIPTKGQIVVTRVSVVPESATPKGPKTKTYSLEELSRGDITRFDVAPSWSGF